MPNPVQQWFFNIPVVTRVYLTSSALLTLAVHLDLVTQFQLYLNFKLVFEKYQIWRLVTCFLYFGGFSFNWLYNMFSIISYCRLLEEGSFFNRPYDFLYMILIFSTSILLASPFLKLPFYGTVLTSCLVYVWSRRNPDVQLSLLGLFNFTAPYLPFIFLGFDFLTSGSIPFGKIFALVIGHIYYFLEDIWPLSPQSNGYRLLATPKFLVRLFESDDNLDEEIIDENQEEHPHQD